MGSGEKKNRQSPAELTTRQRRYAILVPQALGLPPDILDRPALSVDLKGLLRPIDHANHRARARTRACAASNITAPTLQRHPRGSMAVVARGRQGAGVRRGERQRGVHVAHVRERARPHGLVGRDGVDDGVVVCGVQLGVEHVGFVVEYRFHVHGCPVLTVSEWLCLGFRACWLFVIT